MDLATKKSLFKLFLIFAAVITIAAVLWGAAYSVASVSPTNQDINLIRHILNWRPA